MRIIDFTFSWIAVCSQFLGNDPFFTASYQFPKSQNQNDQAELQEIDDQIRELEGIKRGFISKALRHEDQAERMQYQNKYYLEARRHFELAEENRRAADQVQVEIDRLKARRRQILQKHGAGDGFEDL